MSAQDTASAKQSDWLIGVSVGVPGYEAQPVPELLTLGVHWTKMRPGRLGPDISVGTIPRTMSEGLAVLGVRAGVALPLAVSPGVTLLPSGGLSLIGAAGGYGAGGAAGFNAGVAAAFLGPKSIGLRTGITWHRFVEGLDGSVWLLEVGFARGPGRSR